jgi:hypothetical protein
MEAAVSHSEVSWRSYISVSRGHGGRSIRVSWKPKFQKSGCQLGHSGILSGVIIKDVMEAAVTHPRMSWMRSVILRGVMEASM